MQIVLEGQYCRRPKRATNLSSLGVTASNRLRLASETCEHMQRNHLSTMSISDIKTHIFELLEITKDILNRYLIWVGYWILFWAAATTVVTIIPIHQCARQKLKKALVLMSSISACTFLSTVNISTFLWKGICFGQCLKSSRKATPVQVCLSSYHISWLYLVELYYRKS